MVLLGADCVGWREIAVVTDDLIAGAWVVPILLGEWKNYGNGTSPAKYREISGGRLELAGAVANVNLLDALGAIFILPADLWPDAVQFISCVSIPDAVSLQVNTTGEVNVLVPLAADPVALVSLSGIVLPLKS